MSLHCRTASVASARLNHILFLERFEVVALIGVEILSIVSAHCEAAFHLDLRVFRPPSC